MNESTVRPRARLAVATLLLAAILMGGQALARASAPPGGVAQTGRVMAQTSFAYLGGLRTFAAAVLWNRLEPLFHGYYGGRSVAQLVEFLPTMRLVQILDPQFEQAYYNSSFILARQGRVDDGLDIAREGIKNNSNSGLLLANYAQLLLIQDKRANLPEIVKLADRGTRPGVRWATMDDQFEGYGIFAVGYNLAGNQKMSDSLKQAQDAMGKQGAGLGVERDETPANEGK